MAKKILVIDDSPLVLAMASDALQAAGFVEISTWREEKILYFADEDDWWAWEWSQASRFWLEGMTPEGLARFKAGSYEHLRQMKTPQGIPMRWGAQYGVSKTR